MIIWSNLSGWPDHTPKLFRVNHFVPILPVQTSSSNGDDRDLASEWKVVKKKRKVTPRIKTNSENTPLQSQPT